MGPQGQEEVIPSRLKEKEVVWDCKLGKEAAESKGRTVFRSKGAGEDNRGKNRLTG